MGIRICRTLLSGRLRSHRSFKILPILFMLFAAGCGQNRSNSQAVLSLTQPQCQPTAVPNSFVVEWEDGSVTVERGWTPEDFRKRVFEPNIDRIRFAEQDQYAFTDLTPAQVEPASTTWGQSVIQVQSVWQAGFMGTGVKVAVIDSGVDITHSQLAGRLAINDGEIPNNGIDDDNNGFVDDAVGWDFDQDSPNIQDSNGHGTHVAGIVLADPQFGPVQGVAPEAELIPIDFMDSEGNGSIGSAIMGIQYAVRRGASVINASWGGAPCSESLQRTIDQLTQNNVLFIAAAGNSGLNLDLSPEYPAAYLSPAQLTVGASTTRGLSADFSNFSFTFVHLFAPGVQITSTYPGNSTRALSGTSMAAPFVAGAAALLYSARPNATLQQVRQALMESVDKGGFAAITQGRLNVSKALERLQSL